MNVAHFPHTDDDIPRELGRMLAEHSPRLVINTATLLRHPDSPTGWLVVEPMHE